MNVAWGHLGAFVGYHVRIGYPPHFHPGIRFIPHCCQKGQFFSGTNVSLPFTASIPRGHFKILVYTECLFFFWYLGSVTELVRPVTWARNLSRDLHSFSSSPPASTRVDQLDLVNSPQSLSAPSSLHSSPRFQPLMDLPAFSLSPTIPCQIEGCIKAQM